jgi:hypothetical protein
VGGRVILKSVAFVAAACGALAAASGLSETGCSSDYSTAGGDASPDAPAKPADGAASDAMTSSDSASGDSAIAMQDGATFDAGPPCMQVSSYCSTLTPAPSYCNDFDTACVDANVGGYEQSDGSFTTTVSTSAAYAKSAPNALHSTLSALTLTDMYWGSQWSFTAAKTVTIDLDFLLTAAPSNNGDVGVLWLQGGPTAPQNPALILYVSSTTVTYFQIGSSTFSNAGPKVALNAWHHVTAQITTATGTITASIDGMALWNGFLMPGGLPQGTPLTLVAGITTYQLATAETFVDNVVVRNE